MSHNIERPSFLHPEVEPSLDFKYGSFTTVNELKDLPEAIRSRVGKGWVLKKYKSNEGSSDWNQFFGGDDDNLTLPVIAQSLKRRHEVVSDFFGKEFPDLVVPTQFIIGEGEVDDHREKTLYEIQKKVDCLVSSSLDASNYFGSLFAETEPTPNLIQMWLDHASDLFSQDIAKVITEKKKLFELARDIGALMARAQAFVKATGYIPFDIFMPSNLFITADGLRIVDTNGLVSKKFNTSEVFEFRITQFDRSIRFWEEVARKIIAMAET